MRRRSLVAACAVALLLLGTAGRAAGQRRGEPRLMLQFFGGLTAGSPLWEINRQPLVVRGTEVDPKYDSLRLVRRLDPGIILGASGMMFNSPNMGLSAEGVFLLLPTADACTMAFTNTDSDPLRRNEQICTNINGTGDALGIFALTVGGVYRFAPTATIGPYMRGEIGVSNRNSSTEDMAGPYQDFDGSVSPPFVLILDSGKSRTSPTAGAAAGLMLPFTPGYQLRLELRDQMLLLDRITGPAVLAVAPSERFVQHTFSLVVGLDVVLEHKRGRRY